MLGPAIGGYLGTTGDYYFGAKLSALGSLISAVMTLLAPDYRVTDKSDIGEEDP